MKRTRDKVVRAFEEAIVEFELDTWKTDRRDLCPLCKAMIELFGKKECERCPMENCVMFKCYPIHKEGRCREKYPLMIEFLRRSANLLGRLPARRFSKKAMKDQGFPELRELDIEVWKEMRDEHLYELYFGKGE